MAKVISFSLDKDALDLLEETERKFSFRNRSELIRAAVRSLLHEAEGMEKLQGHASAIITVIHHQQSEGEIARVKHQFEDIVATQVHHNLHGECLELFVTHGNAETIVRFFKAIQEGRNVTYAKLVATSR